MTDYDPTLLDRASESIQRWSNGLPIERDPGRDPERYYTTEEYASYNGHAIRLEFTEHDSNPSAYRFNLVIYDADTGASIATGNGGRDWDEALASVHWGGLANRWTNGD